MAPLVIQQAIGSLASAHIAAGTSARGLTPGAGQIARY